MGRFLLVACCLFRFHESPTSLANIRLSTRIITGHVPRDSETYLYAARKILSQRLALEPDNLDLHDRLAEIHVRARSTLAVSFLLREREALARHGDVEREFRCHLRMGVVQARASCWANALAEFRAAAAMNSGAFHRARFAVALIEYVLAASRDENFLSWSGFHLFHPDRSPFAGPIASAQEMISGIEALLLEGMPLEEELFRALGDLHRLQGDLVLAWFSYRQALARGHPAVSREIEAIESHWNWTCAFGAPIESDYDHVIEHAANWRESFQRAELAALTAGLDPSGEPIRSLLVTLTDREVPDLPYFLATTHSYHSRLPEWFVPALIGIFAAAALRLMFGNGWKSRPHIIPPRVRGPGAPESRRATSCART